MLVRTKEQVLRRLHEAQAELRRFGVKRCGVFGSFARNQSQDQSDVDILVEFEPDQKTFDNFMHLAFFLEDLFGRQVDLITTESLSPYIGPHILREVEYASVSP
jgi:predicted nucleotidyltransferase